MTRVSPEGMEGEQQVGRVAGSEAAGQIGGADGKSLGIGWNGNVQ